MEKFFVAQIGRVVGLQGDLKLHLHTDFPKQFQVGQNYQSDRGYLEILSVDFRQGTIKFRGYESRESAQKLTNAKLYATKEQTLANCELTEGQYFWFEVIGSSVIENAECLGSVIEIERILETDYLLVKSDQHLVDAGFSKSFLIPYLPRYILSTDTKAKEILTQDAKDILEAS